jgi:hypothetical protein
MAEENIPRQKLFLEMKDTVKFDGNKKSILRIFNKMGFRYKRFNDGRKFLTEQSYTVDKRAAMFLCKTHEIKVAQLAFITLDVSSEQINLSLCMEGFDRLP